MRTLIKSMIIVLVAAMLIAAPIQAAPPDTGYLWWVNDKVDVLVLYDIHQSLPMFSWNVDGSFPGRDLKEMINKGEACLAPMNSTYKLDSTVHNPTQRLSEIGYDNSVGIKVTSGRCNGFRGWVFHYAALHSDKRK